MTTPATATPAASNSKGPIYIDTQHDDMIHDAQMDYYGTKLATSSSGKMHREDLSREIIKRGSEYEKQMIGIESPYIFEKLKIGRMLPLMQTRAVAKFFRNPF